MARTWSAPQTWDVALASARAARSGLDDTALNANISGFSSPLSRKQSRGGGPQRFKLLLLASALTLAGAALPYIDTDSISNILFLAGAGLAARSLWISATLSSNPAESQKTTSKVKNANVVDTAQFTELLARRRDCAVDRAHWAKLTAHMSHELRTPLNAVLGFSELMSKEVFGPLGSSCYGDYARDIHDSGRQLLKSAEDALAITALLTAPEAKDPFPSACLNSAAEDAIDFHTSDLRSKGLNCAFAASHPVNVIGDAQTVRQLTVNLIAEAMRHTQSGRELAFAVFEGSDSASLSIKVAAEDIQPASGEGFGLILARTLAELAGARVSVIEHFDGAREWVVRFLPAAQRDLFARATAGAV